MIVYFKNTHLKNENNVKNKSIIKAFSPLFTLYQR